MTEAATAERSADRGPKLEQFDGARPEILVVEDDPDIAELITYQLERAGFRAESVDSGEAAQTRLHSAKPDLVILDLMLPGLSGLEWLKWLRYELREAALPVVIVSARGEEADRLLGFELGADDYLVKPFSTRELLLRIRSILNRTIRVRDTSSAIDCGPLQLSDGAHQAVLAGRKLDLTVTEFKLLNCLARNADRTMSRRRLLESVWDYGPEAVTRTLDTYIQRLRVKLGEHRELIQTVRGVGYRLEKRGGTSG